MLVALKKHLAPTDQAKEFEITRRYAKLKSYNKSQLIEQWLDKWERTYSKGCLIAILEVSRTRSLFDFAIAISSIDQLYGYTIEFDINRGIKRNEIPQLTNLVEDFRNYWRKNQAILQTSTSTARVVQFKGDDRLTRQRPPYQYGTNHNIRYCYYQNPFTRLEGWSGNLEIFDKINQALERTKSEPFKQLVLESQKYNGIKTEQPKLDDLKDTNLTPRRNLGAYIASSHLTSHTALLANDSVNRGPGSLYNSQALNTRTDIHICNDRNRSNYTITHPASATNVIDSSKQTYIIESFRTVTINIDTTTRLAYFQLRNVALAPRFMSNLVSMDILAKQQIYQSSRKPLVMKRKDSSHFCILKRNNRHLVFEDTIPKSDSYSAYAATRSSEPVYTQFTKLELYYILAHPGPKAIQHLKDSAVDIIIDSSEPCPCKSDCETCMLAKAQKQVSRRTDGQEPANNKPFDRITYDLIDLCDRSAYNRDNWVSHMGCLISGFQLGTTHCTKSEALAILNATIDFIEA